MQIYVAFVLVLSCQTTVLEVFLQNGDCQR